MTACQPNSSKPIVQTEFAQDGAFATAISYSGRFAAVSSLYHGVSLWDLHRGGLKFHWQQSPEQDLTFADGTKSNSMTGSNFTFASAISFNDSHAVLADKENFSLWNINTGENQGYWQVRKSKYRVLKEDEKGNLWPSRKASGLDEIKQSDLQLVDRTGCQSLENNELCRIDGQIRAIDVSNDGKHILLGKSNGTSVHITVATGRRLEFLGHQTELLDENGQPEQINNAINSVALSPNGLYALTGASDHQAYLWNTKTGQVIHKFRHTSRVIQVALDHKARYAFTSDSKKHAIIWDLKTGKRVSKLRYINRQEVFTFARFSPDGTKLITGAPTRKLSLWNVTDGKQIQEWLVTPRKDTRPASAVVYSAAFINNQTQLVSASSAGLGEVWELKHD